MHLKQQQQQQYVTKKGHLATRVYGNSWGTLLIYWFNLINLINYSIYIKIHESVSDSDKWWHKWFMNNSWTESVWQSIIINWMGKASSN